MATMSDDRRNSRLAAAASLLLRPFLHPFLHPFLSMLTSRLRLVCHTVLLFFTVIIRLFQNQHQNGQAKQYDAAVETTYCEKWRQAQEGRASNGQEMQLLRQSV